MWPKQTGGSSRHNQSMNLQGLMGPMGTHGAHGSHGPIGPKPAAGRPASGRTADVGRADGGRPAAADNSQRRPAGSVTQIGALRNRHHFYTKIEHIFFGRPHICIV